MLAEYDPAKDDANLAKHGVRLGFGVRVFDDDARLVLASIRPIDGEERGDRVGRGKLWTAVYVERGAAVRLISVRRSNVDEQRNYNRDSG